MLQGPPPEAAGPDADEAALAFGIVLVREQAPALPLVDVWASNWPAVRLFEQVRDQWRHGPGGPVALDHGALPARARPGCGGRRGQALLADLLVMQDEALAWFEERRARR